MSTIAADPATELAQRQLDAAMSAHTAARSRYDAVQARIAELADDAPAEEVNALAAELDEAGTSLEDTHAEAERCKANLESAQRRASIATPAPARTATARGQLRSELTYRPDRDGGIHGEWQRMVTDLWAAQSGMGGEAAERIHRSNLEQRDLMRDSGIHLRDVGTSAFAGLTVPQFLIDLYAPFLRAGRPVANMVRRDQLPEKGMTLSISRLTTGTAVAEQATENAAVQETDEDDTKLDVSVRTYAGQQDVSRQALERSEGVEDITYADLAAAYATKLDSAIINQDGTSGMHLGIRSTVGIVAVTYTDASPTLAELYPKGADAMQQVNGGIFTGATAWVMHSRRWGWFTAALDSTSRPFVVPDASGPFNPLAVGDAGEYGQVVGRWHGKPVVLDDNIPTNLGAGTNEDVILGLRSPELLLWEEGDGAPRRLKFEETAGGNLTVKLVVYGYSAFTAGRYPKAAAVISGTGLVTPTF